MLYLIFETGERAGGGKPQKYLGQMCSAEHHLHHHVYHPYSRHRHHYHDYLANTTISILIIDNIMIIITKDAKDRSALRPARDQELHGGQALALVAGLR